MAIAIDFKYVEKMASSKISYRGGKSELPSLNVDDFAWGNVVTKGLDDSDIHWTTVYIKLRFQPRKKNMHYILNVGKFCWCSASLQCLYWFMKKLVLYSSIAPFMP